MTTPSELRDRLDAVMIDDGRRLRRRIDRAVSRADGEREAALAELDAEVAKAEQLVAARAASVPEIRYPDELPITAWRDDILELLRNHQVVIVAGETGSGKSTQLPKLCLEAGRGVRGVIGHTQPRRLAARTVAERVAEEVGSDVGDTVGYTVRFTDRVGDKTLVKVMTDGILLAEIQRDRFLNRYDTLIIDEAHERSLNIDFILGYLKQLLPKRPDLQVIVTSATIDTERFSRHFEDAPVVEVSGRTYPVELRYRPIGEDPDDDRDQVTAICDAVRELGREGPGDVLVFLSGEREIRDAADALAKEGLRDTEILPLYARLSAAEQHRVFQAHKGRRVVLATNVAETSLTVPGIRYVVDPGFARISRYSRRTKVQRLPIEAISQASANQRAGRCGRVAPGICIRLYTEDDFDARPEFTEPEILRTNLASVILQMTALRFDDIASFPFVEPPDQRAIRDGLDLLEELGALDLSQTNVRKRLTPIGRQLAQLPIDPRLARMVVEAARNDCVHEVMIIAAALSIQDPRERPAEKRQVADEYHRRFFDDDSDFVSLLNLWDYVRAEQKARSGNQFRKMCRTEFLNFLRVREWQDIYSQLRQVLRTMGIRPKHRRDRADADAIHKSLLAGLLSHVGMRDTGKEADKAKSRGGKPPSRRDQRFAEYLGARNANFAIAPGSTLYKEGPRWVMAGELVETNRMWARVVARIQPEWAERLGDHVAKYTYSEPWWDARRGAAVANERVTIYGIPVVAARKIAYGRVDPAAARAMFIQHALVEGDWETHHAFFAQNRKLVEEVRALEDRVRRRDILVADDVLFEVYDRRIGDDVTSKGHFDRWWKQERKRHPDLLDLTFDDLVVGGADEISLSAFPDVWHVGDLALAVHYEFEPGSPTDGVTVDVPLAALAGLPQEPFDWQVPGLRLELVTELIRSMPKDLRKTFIPAPDHARAALARISPSDGPLLEVLARDLARTSGAPVTVDSFHLDRVPAHLLVTFRVFEPAEDGSGEVIDLAVSTDLDALREHLRGRLRDVVSSAAASLEQDAITSWSIGDLPKAVETKVGGHAVVSYPSLVDEGGTVAVRLLLDRDAQAVEMWGGTRRLLRTVLPSPTKALQQRLDNQTKLALARPPFGGGLAELVDDIVTGSLDHLMAEHDAPVWDAVAFDELRQAVGLDLVDTVVEVAKRVGTILATDARITERLGAITLEELSPVVADVRHQLTNLVFKGFVSATGVERLPDVTRYLQAIMVRLENVGGNVGRDRQDMLRVNKLERQYEALLEHADIAEVEHIHWMLEELRVSVFAQRLGTTQKVSEKRIRTELQRFGG
ncbi:MAG: ATP-dependent RNA helicase HrpA [Actinomycetota bacterium]|nr:ATP-dependent RNA helicase HrpA [Actinomycetota bacterium]